MNLDDVVSGCESNNPKYWEDPYLKLNKTLLRKVVFEDRKAVYLITDPTIFHPKYGGQPSDRGKVYGKGFSVNINKTMRYKRFIVLYGKVEFGVPREGDVVEEIDWSLRYTLMKRHTASHLLDHTLRLTLGSHIETIDSWLGDDWYISYKGPLPAEELLKKAVELENSLIKEGYIVSSRLVSRASLLEEAKNSPNLTRLPELDVYRLVKINGFEDIACSGTHLRSISEIGKVIYIRSEPMQDGFRVYLSL
ncbi:MAG: alanyl-tRNA editing protein [Nitrososphaeria archaeon]